jgi:anti-anti-sigma factor
MTPARCGGDRQHDDPVVGRAAGAVTGSRSRGACRSGWDPGSLRLHEHRPDPTHTVLCVDGELDRQTAPLLAARLDELVRRAADGAVLTVDLAGTSFVDVGGVRTLLDACGRARQRGIEVRVGACRRQFLRVLSVTGAAALIEVVPDPPRCGLPR